MFVLGGFSEVFLRSFRFCLFFLNDFLGVSREFQHVQQVEG